MTRKTRKTVSAPQKAARLARAKQLAERIVSAMTAQGYQDIEYILTGSQLKVVASHSTQAPQTVYLNMPDPGLARQSGVSL